MLTNNKTYQKTNLRDNQITFTDGVCFIYSSQERTLKELKGKFYFSRASVGIKHFWEAYANEVVVDESINIPFNNITVNPQDICKIGNEFFKIVRVQFHDNKLPNYWQLSLERQPFDYKGEV